MKTRLVFEIEFDEKKLKQVFQKDFAEMYIRLLQNRPVTMPGKNGHQGIITEEDKEEIIKALALQQILGKNNHGADIGNHYAWLWEDK